MERTQLFELLDKNSRHKDFDEIMATAVKRSHKFHRSLGNLFRAEIPHKQGRYLG